MTATIVNDKAVVVSVWQHSVPVVLVRIKEQDGKIPAFAWRRPTDAPSASISGGPDYLMCRAQKTYVALKGVQGSALTCDDEITQTVAITNEDGLSASNSSVVVTVWFEYITPQDLALATFTTSHAVLQRGGREVAISRIAREGGRPRDCGVITGKVLE